MSIGIWWTHKSGKAKVVTGLATLVILQIGLCFATPTIVPWFESLLHAQASGGTFEDLVLVALQAMLCVATLGAIFLVVIFWHPGLSSSKRRSK